MYDLLLHGHFWYPKKSCTNRIQINDNRIPIPITSLVIDIFLFITENEKDDKSSEDRVRKLTICDSP